MSEKSLSPLHGKMSFREINDEDDTKDILGGGDPQLTQTTFQNQGNKSEKSFQSY